MDAIKSFKEVDALSEKLLKLRKRGSDLEDALIEDTVDYFNGHLEQINRRILLIGDRLDSIEQNKVER